MKGRQTIVLYFIIQSLIIKLNAYYFTNIFILFIQKPLGAGKTSIIQKFINNIHCEKTTATIGVDYLSKQYFYKNKNGSTTQYLLQIWDTAGQERFKSLSPAYLRGAHGVVLVMSRDNEQCIENIEQWKKLIIDNVNRKTPVIFLFNKSDLDQPKKFKIDDLKDIIMEDEKYMFSGFLETSVKYAINIEEAFDELVCMMVDNSDNIGEPEKGLVLNENDLKAIKKNKNSCC